MDPVLVDQSPIGINPRSNVATYTHLAEIIRDLFYRATGLPAAYFSFNRPEGACPTCNGMGAVEVKMRYLPTTWNRCPDCGGEQYSEEVLAAAASFNGLRLNIAEFLDQPVNEVITFLESHPLLEQKDRQTTFLILEAPAGYWVRLPENWAGIHHTFRVEKPNG